MAGVADKRLINWRNKLIDLSKRNRLLNFKPTKVTTVKVIEELPTEVFRTLVIDEDEMEFLPRAEEDEVEEAEPPEEGLRYKDIPNWNILTGNERIAVIGAVSNLQEPRPIEEIAGQIGMPVDIWHVYVTSGLKRLGYDKEFEDITDTRDEPQARDKAIARFHQSLMEMMEKKATETRPANMSGEDGLPEPGVIGPEGLQQEATVEPTSAQSQGPTETSAGEGGPRAEVTPQEFESYDPSSLAHKHKDNSLQTDLPEDKLRHNLLRIYQKASSIFEEQGYNTLFISLGSVQWFESKDSDIPFIAPILLVPVELKRQSVHHGFRLIPFDEDPILNPALLYKLETEYNIQLSPLPEDFQGFNLQDLFKELTEALSFDPRWRVRNDIYLSLFSFTKFIMYKDIVAHEDAFLTHPIVKAICGDTANIDFTSDRLGPDTRLDEVLDPRSTHYVLEADSSQQEAILAVQEGCNLVLEGPPGTGKSQTITNMIAESLATGKTVLFVSQKMAALEVVKGRLEDVGFGDFCLELHSHKASKKQVISSLGSVLELERRQRPIDETYYTNLRETRSTLNLYAKVLHEPFGNLGISPFIAIGTVADLETKRTPEIKTLFRNLDRVSMSEYSRVQEKLQSLADRYAVVRPLRQHPWYGTDIRNLTYQMTMQVQTELETTLQRLRNTASLGIELDRLLGLSQATTFKELTRSLEIASLILSSPGIVPRQVKEVDWTVEKGKLDSVIQLGTRYTQEREAVLKVFNPEITGTNLDRFISRLSYYAQRPFRFLSREYRALRKEVKQHMRNPRMFNPHDILPSLKEVGVLKGLEMQVGMADAYGLWAFDQWWKGKDSDWTTLHSFMQWMSKFQRHYREGRMGESTLALAMDNASHSKDIGQAMDRQKAEFLGFGNDWEKLKSTISINEDLLFDGKMTTIPISQVEGKLIGMIGAMNRLDEHARFQEILSELKSSWVSDFLEPAIASNLSREQFVPAFKLQFLRCWMDLVFIELPELKKLDRTSHDQIVSMFRRLDKGQTEISQRDVMNTMCQRLPDMNWNASKGSELAILKREVLKKKRHLPIRVLLSKIPGVLRTLKPCMLMSPLSVAQFLDPEGLRFDLVIFDEASQIPIEDALGAIIRGSQVVVVGDTRQLPPTTFFQAEVMTDEDEPEDDEVVDLESILDECSSIFPFNNKKMLRWHYRSRDETLIAFSNYQFYENRLYTFPSPYYDKREIGIELVHLPNAVYDRGKSRTNIIEAKAVAHAVIDHFRAHPDMSLGVGAFNLQQQEAILDAVDELAYQNPDIEPLLNPNRHEHFFVKNLETIQGDERDVILISVGYGRDPTGKMTLNFGPLNKVGGERRLNVLVTRARYKVKIFSSISGDDIDPSKTSSIGAIMLKHYLDYVKAGSSTSALVGKGIVGGESESPFEAAVARTLEMRGFEIEKQVGVSGYRIDLGVKDKGRPGRYVLGIECDGAQYHSSRTARDRDRLRQEVLEGLGWTIHRVWSTDWFRDPVKEIERIECMLSSCAKKDSSPTPLQLTDHIPDVDEYEEVIEEPEDGAEAPAEPIQEESGIEVIPYRSLKVVTIGYQDEFYHSSTRTIADILDRVVAVEGPIHKKEAAKRVAEHWGFTYAGTRVQERIDNVMRTQKQVLSIRREGDFLWPSDMKIPPIRKRDYYGVPNDIELIPPEEIQEAVKYVLMKEYCVPQDVLIPRTANLMGFKRTSDRIRHEVEKAIVRMIKDYEIVSDDRGVRLAGNR